MLAQKSVYEILVDSDDELKDTNIHNSKDEDQLKDKDNGSNKLLKERYTLWSHDISVKEWDLKSYKKICEINSVSDFWRLFNNFYKLNMKYTHFYLMKEGITPLWEDVNNRSGGICSMRIEFNNSYELWELLCVHLVCDILTDDSNDINGVSFSPKNNWVILKVWNKDSKKDVSKKLNKFILNKYNNISIKYKENEPEY